MLSEKDLMIQLTDLSIQIDKQIEHVTVEAKKLGLVT